MLPHNDNENEIIFVVQYGNGNERNVMTPTLVTLVTSDWQFGIITAGPGKYGYAHLV